MKGFNRFVFLVSARRAAILLTALFSSIVAFLWYKFGGENPRLPPSKQPAVHGTAGPKEYFGAGKGYNLIVVQLESFQNFVVNLTVQGQKLTPNLNELVADSIYFPYVFQQIGQGNTSDAEFLSNTSLYPVGSTAMSSAYADRKLPSMARLMHERGYITGTFHVNDVEFWNRDQMYPALGFDRYYDKPYYSQEVFNRFGASDEELYTVAVNKLLSHRRNNKRFYAQLVTVSSHFPFKVPDDRARLKLDRQLNRKPLGDYLTAINYADYALGTFVEKLEKTGLWDNSVLVIYGDHFGLNKKKYNPVQISEALGIRYHKQISTFNVPLLIHLPGKLPGRIVNQTGGQIDILPTVANIMGISLNGEGFTAFGQDLLNVEHNIIGMRYYLPTGSFFNDDILFIPGKKGFEDGIATTIRTFERVKDITPFKPEYDKIIKQMKQSDEYVKHLPFQTGF